MSSPLSNLKKGKKAPLGSRPPPYKPTPMSEEDLISQLNYERSMDIAKQSKNGEKITDMGLLSSMMNRLNVVENQLGECEKQIREKDKQIRILEEKCEIYKRAQGHGTNQVDELQKKCHKLQNQVHSMENFLEDYGMIWVGNPNSSDEEDEDDENELDGEMYGEENTGDAFSGNKLWNPQCSVSTPRKFNMNFDLVMKNIKELNAISGEGEHYIKHTKDGARLQVKEPVPLKLYANGIFMFGGPFRPYEDHQTQLCVQDLMDGYFPGELQNSYPDGVPFNVEDKRDVYFKDKRLEALFPGKGQTLSPEKRNDDSRVDVTTSTDDRKTETIDNIVHHRQSVEQFLARLPPAVMKNGKIIDVRDGIKKNLSSDTAKNEVIVVETDTMKDIKERVNSGSKSRPSTASSVTTLRIKSPSGDQTYMLKMRYTDTLFNVKEQLNKVTGQNDEYVLKTSFPNATYTDLDKTLRECGLVPNATLHIVRNVASTT